MEINESNIAGIITAIFAGIAVLITAWTNYRVSTVKSEQSDQKKKLEVVIDETKEVKHLVNSTQTNLQTAIDDLRAENLGLKQDKIDLKAEVAAAPEVQDVKIVNDPKVPSESVPVVTAETPTEEGE